MTFDTSRTLFNGGALLRLPSLALGFALGLVGVSPAAAQGNQDLIWIDYPEQGVVLGQGYNLVTDEPTQGVCVDFVPVQDPSQEVTYRFEEVTSHSTINASSRIHASGSLKMALVKASAKLDFYSKENFSIDTSKFLLTANVTNSSLFAGPSFAYKMGASLPGIATLPDTLKEAATNGITRAAAPTTEGENTGVKFKNVALRNNIKHCGQGYIAAIVSGAQVDAFLTFTKSDAESVAEIKAGIKATIGGIFSVSGSFAQNQQAIERSERTEVNVYRSGGRAAAIAYDLPGLRTSLQQLPVDAAANPKPIRIAVIPYSKLDDSPLAGGLQAVDLLDSIAAFFLVRDVVNETSDIADWYQNYDVDQIASPETDSNVARNIPLFLHPLDDYIAMNDRALALNREMSEALRLCQSALQDANLLLDASNAAAETAAGDKAAGRTLEAQQRAILTGSPAQEAASAPYKDLVQQLLDEDVNQTDRDVLERLLAGMQDNAQTQRSAQFASFLSAFEPSEETLESKARIESAVGIGAKDLSEADLAALRTKTEKTLATCNSDSGYLKTAIDDALALSQDFLAAKPIFWSDLGRHYQGRLWKLFPGATLPQGQSSWELVDLVTEDLKSFHANMVAKRFKRDICQRDLTHPVCGAEFEAKFKPLDLKPSTLVLAGLSAGLAQGLE
ncbi:hypothetical protein [Tropicibacter oceani]|uniref:Uncharacterized protein n=1 Tax=Tropicibacter oceani TaxID=3058420 RepID=A0ABY8QIE6_9RHOB|nr:hypothetical protein [Tropicibacter oceani]WGW04213.1 hypothetical protein QF118_01365 [Tropicibacter oceani]